MKISLYMAVAVLALTPTARGSQMANLAYGQPNLYSNLPGNTAVPEDARLYAPRGCASDSDGVYISDYDFNRILFFPHGSVRATRVYGQPSFSSGLANYGGISANSLSRPWGLAVDGEGLYVADYLNCRVLFYPKGSTTAARVYGQPGFASSSPNLGGVSATSLSYPEAVATDGAGGLYVSDSSNNRVLYYPPGSTAATFAYGQDSLTRNAAGGGPGNLSWAKGVAVEHDGVYVTDYGNHRVLYFLKGARLATRVYGQPGFYSYTPNAAGIGPNTLQQPNGLAHDGTGLYVSDYLNSRVLYFPGTETMASTVYGETDFTTVRMNYGGVTPAGFYVPWGVSVSDTYVYGHDSYNARVIRWTKDNSRTPASVAFDTMPGPGVAGQPLSAQPVVKVLFSDGTLATTFSGWVTLALKAGVGPDCAKVTGTASAQAIGGVATFTNLAIDHPGEYRLQAYAATLPLPDSAPFAVSPAAGQWQPGDVNGDGQLNAGDVAAVLRIAAGLEAGS